MNLSAAFKKVLLFGLFGVAGALAGWLVAEPALWAATQLATAAGAGQGPSLIATPADPAPPPLPRKLPDPAPPPLPNEFRERLERAGGKSGDVQVSLIWYNVNDLDLHVIDPNGERIYYKNPRSRSGGELDVDANAGTRDASGRPAGLTREPVENIYWPTGGAPAGRYQVFVNHFAHRPEAPNQTRFKVNVLHEGKRHEFEGDIRNNGSTDNFRTIYEFELKPRLDLAAPQEVELTAGQSVRVPVAVERWYHTVAVAVTAENLPEGVTAEPGTIAAGTDMGEVVLRAASSAGRAKKLIKFIATGGGLTGSADTNLAIVQPRLDVAAPPALEACVGGTVPVPVRVSRANYAGPVEIKAENLPEGVTAEPVTVPAGKDETVVLLKAASGAGRAKKLVKFVAKGGELTGSADSDLAVVPPALSLWAVCAIGLWTALLAVGLCVALLAGQNRYVGKRPFAQGAAALAAVALGAAAAGFVSGALGQVLYYLFLAVGIGQVGFLIGWLLLGVLLGWGVSFFVPNLDAKKAALAGAGGGFLGAVAFAVLALAADLVGRFGGAAVLGFCIGLMVAVVEAAFRRAWLEVRFGEREVITVNLGPEPVKVGGDARACAVWARGAPPVALKYWVRDGKVLCEDAQTRREVQVGEGDARTAGGVTVVVRTGGAPVPAAPPPPAPPELPPKAPAPPALPVPPVVPPPVVASAPPPKPPVLPPAPKPPANDYDDGLPMPMSPPPPARAATKSVLDLDDMYSAPAPPKPAPVPAAPKPPVSAAGAPKPPAPSAPPKPAAHVPAPPKPTASAPPKAGEPDACPTCGRKSPGKPGARYCMVCDRTF
jgi:hypothetical protein